MLRGFFLFHSPPRGRGLPFLVPGAVGLFGPDGGLVGYLTALDADARVAVVIMAGADNMLLLQADYRYAGLNICLFHFCTFLPLIM